MDATTKTTENRLGNGEKMRVSKNTIERVEAVKAEVELLEQRIEILVARIQEHPGTKKIAAKLNRAKEQLENWRMCA